MFRPTHSPVNIKSSPVATDPTRDKIGAQTHRRSQPIIFVALLALALLALARSHVTHAQQCTLKTSRFLGDSCYSSDDCHYGLLCDDNVCRDMVPYMLDRYVNVTQCIGGCYATVSNYPTQGSTQKATSKVQLGLTCTDQGRCVPLRRDGDACTSSQQCLESNQCVGGKCVAAQANNACDSIHNPNYVGCASGHYCDFSTQVCVAMVAPWSTEVPSSQFIQMCASRIVSQGSDNKYYCDTVPQTIVAG